MTGQPEKSTPSSGKRVFIMIPEGYYDWPEERQTAFLAELVKDVARGSAEPDVREEREMGVYFENDDSPGAVYYFVGDEMFIYGPATEGWIAGNEFSRDGFHRRWRDGWISGPLDNPPEGVPPCDAPPVAEAALRVARDVGGPEIQAAPGAPAGVTENPTGASPEELWNEAVQALMRCDAAEFLSEEYMAESRIAQDLFERAAVGFSEAGNTEMATEAAQVVARLARFNSVDWGDPADVETSDEEPVYAEDGITLIPPRGLGTPVEG
ncbi:hypothetical protein TESS_TESS_01164 [Tessaracoccus sp. O5.2]